MKISVITKLLTIGAVLQLSVLGVTAQSLRISDVGYYEKGNNLHISADIDLYDLRDQRVTIQLMFFNSNKKNIISYRDNKYTDWDNQLRILQTVEPREQHTELDDYTMTIPISELGDAYTNGELLHFSYKIWDNNRPVRGEIDMYELTNDYRHRRPYDDDDDDYDYDYDDDDDDDEEYDGSTLGLLNLILDITDEMLSEDDDDRYDNRINGRDKKSDFKALMRKADRGDAEAQFAVAECYEEGYGVTEDDYKAFKWYKKSAENGYTRAMHALAECYYDGEGISRNYSNALKWFTEAAEEGYAPSQYELGCMYYDGKGVSRDRDKGKYWLKKASKQGYKKATSKLSDIY
ncbi:MAG: tetratricopeptide repeat protein [Rikenellaceae bacterium]